MATIGRPRVRVFRSLTTAALITAFFLTCLSGAFAAPPTEVVSARMLRVSTPRGIQTVPDLAASGQALVKISAGTSRATFMAELQEQGYGILHAYRSGNWVLVQLPQGQTVPQGVEALRRIPVVRAAEPDRMAYLLAIPDDPLYDQQYHWPLISAPSGWDIQTGSSNTVVAIIDSGIQLNHPDLVGRIWNNPHPGSDPRYPNDLHGWDFVDEDNDPQPEPEEEAENWNVSHGTHVAGLVGAATDNAVGVAGLDWQCKLMAVKVFDRDGSAATSTIIRGFEYAAEKGAHVINMSLGGGYSEAWNDPITAAYAAGVTVVCAAGNEAWTFTDDQTSWSSPVCNDGPNYGDNHVLGVAACNSSKVISWLSNLDGSSRSFVDVVAPGSDILSTLPVFPDFPEFSAYYGEMSGTSMACPIAAGLVALTRAQYPAATPGELINRIRNACTNIDAENPTKIGMMGAGLIQVNKSLADQPPGPVRNLKAFSPANSRGGSIDIAWTASVDDGAGEMDVVNYAVYKASSATGPWEDLTQLPATGAITYSVTDSPVPNATPFYYRVDTSDEAGHITPSQVVGPVEARDSVPPMAITTLTAFDTPNDQGGSITLDWTGFSPPPEDISDFAKYNIYRSTSPFNDVSAIPVLATVTDVNARRYQDKTTEDGTSYYYAVTMVDMWGNEGKTGVQTAGPVTSYPNLTVTWPIGLSMISLPLNPPNPDMGAILNLAETGVMLARWDPASGAYVYYSENPSSPLLRQRPGAGFWIKTTQALTVRLAGFPAPEGDVAVPVGVGWNMIGNPYSTDVLLGTAMVTCLGTTETLDASNQNGHTTNYAWTYDALANSYRLISAHLPFATQVIKMGQGAYFYAAVPATLTLMRPVGALQAEAPEPIKPGGDNWSLRLQASVQGQSDNDNFIGVSPQAANYNGVRKPPMAAEGVQLFFGEDGANPLATSFVTPAEQNPTWDIAVSSAQPGAEVTIVWPDLTTVPNSIRPVLTDLATGRSVYMRTVSSYQFVAGTTPRRFRLSLAGQSGVTLTSVTATATAAGAQIAYGLAAPAQVSVEIMNLSGRTVRIVSSAKLSPAGISTVVWDGRNASGAAAPSGLYLVRITAESDTGERATVLRPLSLNR